MGGRVLFKDDAAPGLPNNKTVSYNDSAIGLNTIANRQLAHFKCSLDKGHVAWRPRLEDGFSRLLIGMNWCGTIRTEQECSGTRGRKEPSPRHHARRWTPCSLSGRPIH